ncbi:MAG: transcription-repair coupling factor [Armatimonadota bacterium]|nr:transcription-repair coupling factor [Armatimonadota bacterium]MDR5697923.1 transcription-repair coupling factor [Armatimonadota bacterium]
MSLRGLVPLVDKWEPFVALRGAVRSGDGIPWVTGPSGSYKALLMCALLSAEGDRPVFVLTAGREAAERLCDDVAAFAPSLRDRIRLFPPAESLPHDELPPSPETVGERLRALRDLASRQPVVVAAPVAAVQRRVARPEVIRGAMLELRADQQVALESVVGRLAAGGYERVSLVQSQGAFAARGGIVDVYPPGSEYPVRIEWFGDVIESIRVFDVQTQRSERRQDSVAIPPAAEPEGDLCVVDLLPDGALLVLDEPVELEHQAHSVHRAALEVERQLWERGVAPLPYLSWNEIRERARRLRVLPVSALHGPPEGQPGLALAAGAVDPFAGQVGSLAQEVQRWQRSGQRVVVASAQAHRVAEVLADHGVAVDTAPDLDAPPAPGSAVAVPIALSGGFRIADVGLVVVTDAEVLGWRRRRRKFRVAKEGAILRSWTDVRPGDLVVHVHHGIGRFVGVTRKAIDGAERDYLHLAYAEGDALYVPTDQIGLVQRYVGVEGAEPRIHRLGTAEWDREKRKVREATQQIARELLEIYARREMARGHAFAPDSPWQRELEASFQFEETPDQWQAIQDVKRDMEAPKPMDRLVAGDVGYGKTEVALRAAFKAVMDGKQVAVLVPTTLLAQQHYGVFASRFAAFPVRVEMVSRFRSPQQTRAVLDGLRTGEVDVVIGTHRLLQKDVRFRDLGLVIIDEEQRFGVRHKERLKQLRASVDVLTLTATPIPRTLHMSLVGLRDMSVMETPPDARQPIRTVIEEDDDAIVQEAIRREMSRGGQVYVVHNRVQTIERAARRIQAIVPDARVAIAHGQMPEARLEKVMVDFVGGRYDVLVCTTIVEIGIDIPQVNTIIVQDAHQMGLAQLYQLRGRVGRADRQAYAYLVYPRGVRLTEEAAARLQAMREFVELGSGLRLAMRDLEIRGAGNLLGPEQHGHVAAVGFDLYTRLLDEAIRRLRGEFVEEAPDPVIELRLPAFLPESYIPDEPQRLSVYRRLAALRSSEEAAALRDELRDRYGAPPEPVTNLIEIATLREHARAVGAVSVTQGPRGVLIRMRGGLSPREKTWLPVEFRGRVRAVPEGLLLTDAADALAVRAVRDVLDALARLRQQGRVGSERLPAGGIRA